MISKREYRAPLNCSINVTGKCNLNCLHCSAAFDSNCNQEMTFFQLKDVIMSLVNKINIFEVSITGGEPLLRKDIFKILLLLKDNRIPTTLYTNATLITEEVASQLKDEASIKEIVTSLDGATSSTHDALRGPGAFEKTLEGINLLIKAGFKVYSNCVISKLNMDQYDQIVNLAKDIGISSVGFLPVSIIGRAKENSEIFNFTKAELDSIYDKMKEIEDSNSNTNGFSVSCAEVLSWPKEESKKIINMKFEKNNKMPLNCCGICRESIVITPDGYLVPCNKFWDYRIGNVLEHDILDLYNSEKAQQIRNLVKITSDQLEGCGDCLYSNYCGGGCRADAYALSGSLKGIDIFRCVRHYIQLKPNDMVFS